MKVIDLINKIANGEDVPKKIKWDYRIYEYEEGTYDWSYYVKNNGTIKYLLTDVFNSNDNILNILNDEVEIIEHNPYEDKKIDKLNLDTDELRGKEIVRSIDYLLESKINEIIDRLNGEDNEL